MNWRKVAAFATALAVITTAFTLWEPEPPLAPVMDDGDVLVGNSGDTATIVLATHDAPARVEPSTSRVLVADAQQFRVRVLAGSAPVPGAKCLAATGVSSTHAISDGAGIAVLPFVTEVDGDCTLQVTSAGHAPAMLWLREPWGRTIDVVLLPDGGVVRGVVRRDGLRPLPAPLQVVAWPQAMPDAADLIAAGGGVRVGVAPDGSFQMIGLEVGRAYSFGVAAPGWTARRIEHVEPSAAPGVREIEILACRVYAAIVQTREAGGSQPPVSDFAYMAFSSDAPGFKALAGEQGVTWALAGLWAEARDLDPRRSWTDWLIGFRGDSDGAVARASIRYFVPGFVGAAALIEIHAVASSLPVKRLVLQRLPGELVDVEIVCTHAIGDPQARFVGRPGIELRFRDITENDGHIWRRYEHSFASRTLRGVPAGEYEIGLWNTANDRTLLPQEGRRLTFGRGRANRVTFDTSGLATLHVLGSDAGFDLQSRQFEVGGKAFAFAAGPYVMGGLKPGRARFSCGKFKQYVDLVAGKVTTLQLPQAPR